VNISRIRDRNARVNPGLFDMPAAAYHADCSAGVPSLSSSIAKVMLSDTPRHAWLKHPRLNPEFEFDDNSKFDLGSVAHELILGKGGGFQVLEFADWRSNLAKAARAEAINDGKVPILTHQHEAADAMAIVAEEAIREIDPDFYGDDAESEVVAVWDDMGGARCRSMIDRFDGITIWDVKTTDLSLSDGALSRQIVNMGYDLSAAFYLRGMSQLMPEMAGRFKFRWVFIEANAPHEVRVIEADNAMLTLGDKKAALAIEKWKNCIASVKWPGYPRTISKITCPGWAESQWLEREMSDDDAVRSMPMSKPNPTERVGSTIVYGG
jgi:PDDEXK-like domain of unknown function (DUF3799)